MSDVTITGGIVLKKSRKFSYYTNRHSYFLLQYHLVLVTKYRHPVIKDELETFLKDYTKKYFKERGVRITAFETMPDHIHILFDAPPQINLADFVNAYKSASSRHIRKKFEEKLKPYYWKPYFWSLSYFIGSVSDRSADAVEDYIKNQKE
ncbi:IS200/IS605 family transposase [Methanobrevibacter sp.]|uniref:IS200/IS605 family transposase n=1 Tax=Methanobrevibacter sp. TaxID=66852 RepID=UPI00386C9407